MELKPDVVAIATNTFYPKWYEENLKTIFDTDKVRGDLALEFCKKASSLGYKVVVVDGNSTKAFISALSKIDGLKIIKRGEIKRSPARRQAIEACSQLPNIDVIVLTEPEKVSFLTECLVLAMQPVLEKKANIVVPKRNADFFLSSYPHFQYESETEANTLLDELLRSHGLMPSQEENLDMIFGPRVFYNDSKTIECFMQRFSFDDRNLLISREFFDPEEVAGTMFFPIVLAQKKKLRIRTVTVPFRYPLIQKRNEEAQDMAVFWEKRKNQRSGILACLVHFIAYLEGYPESRIRSI